MPALSLFEESALPFPSFIALLPVADGLLRSVHQVLLETALDFLSML